MTLDDDDPDASKGFSTQFMLQNKMSMANNVLVKRRLQLKHWENSDMNKLAASKKPSIDTKVKFQDSDVFLSACVSGDEEEVEDLLEKGANINTCTIDGVTALHQAVIDGKLETVRFLLDHGADLNAQDNEGWTPLHAAVCCGILAIVKYLCERGADLSHVNSDKELAIDLAEDDEIRAYLEEQLRIQNVNADECRDREFHTMMRDCTEWIRCGRYLDKPHPRTGATALHVASSKGYNQLIGLLIRAGANVDAKDFEGWTPLHAAAHWGEKDACRILMENGAKLSGLTNTGQDVLRVADANVVEFLENLQEQIEQSSPAQPPISPNNVLVENNNIPAPSKRPPSVQRLSSEEKHTLQKKDEHDENVSLSTKVLESNDSPPEDHSISPPPAKKQEIELKEKEPTPIENIVLHGVKLRKQRSVESPSEQSTFVTAVLPAPKFTATSSTPSSSRESSVSKSNGSTSETISERESSVASNSFVSTSSSTAVIRNTPTPVPVIRSQRMVFPSEERRSPEYQSTSKSEEEASASSSTVPSGSESASRSCSEEVGTGSQISSIRTSSRSVSSKDSISSNLYSSDQNVECTLRVNQPVAPRVSTSSSSTTATRPTWNNSQNITTRPSVSNSSSSSVSSETTTTNTRKVFPVISQQSASLAPLARVTSPSSSESPSPSPLGSPASNTGMFRKTSWQTPPTQPAPQKETEAERKAKARIQRAARRSTQGVTADQLNEARAASDDFGKWKSSTLQQTITTSNTNADTNSSEAESISKTTTEESASSQKNSHVMANLLLPASCPSPSSTPSAAKMNRRSQASRGNRRGTGPVDLDALNNAISISTSESSESSHPVNDPKVTRVTVSMKERLGSSEIMNASKSLETDNTSRFPSVSSTTRTSGPTSKPLLSSTYANGTITTSADASDRYKILYEKEREENERLRKKIDDLNLRLSKTEINGNVWQNNGGRNSHNSNSDTGRSNSTPLDDQERRSYERKIGELEYELGKTKQLQADNKRLKDENGALIRVISKLSKPSS